MPPPSRTGTSSRISRTTPNAARNGTSRQDTRSRAGATSENPASSMPLAARAFPDVGGECLKLAADPILAVTELTVRAGPRVGTVHGLAFGYRGNAREHAVDGLRFVQLTPPGSACSIALGTGVTDARPGSATGLQLVVSDIEAARTRLLDGGVEVSAVQDLPWGRFLFFADPDGNRWSVQQIVRPG